MGLGTFPFQCVGLGFIFDESKKAQFIRFSKYIDFFHLNYKKQRTQSFMFLGIKEIRKAKLDLYYVIRFLKKYYNMNLPILEYNPIESCFTSMELPSHEDIISFWDSYIQELKLCDMSSRKFYIKEIEDLKKMLSVYPEELKRKIPLD